ncbi:MAG: hypothetical protein L6Q52_07985 [Rhodocyclaceae bacterium]|nr:hypothetical protein [Rhodocyclaceae bacterium]
MAWAGVGVSMRSSGLPRYSATSSRSGRRTDSIRWVVRKPSWPTMAGVSDSSAALRAIRFRSAAPWASLAITWMKPVSSTQ